MKRRALRQKLIDAQANRRAIATELDRIPRSDDRYLEIVTREHHAIKYCNLMDFISLNIIFSTYKFYQLSLLNLNLSL